MKTRSLLCLAGLTAAIQFVSCAKNDLDSTPDLSQANDVTTATEAVTTSLPESQPCASRPKATPA